MKSIICASMHKAGSTISDRILLDIIEAKGFEIDRISLQVSASPLSQSDLYIQYQDKMKLAGVYYGVARGPYVADMPRLKEIKVITQVRDPRDCITSLYFSLKFSHPPPENPAKRADFLKRREEVATLGIDAYALTKIENYKLRMQALRDLETGHDDLLSLRYEDMVLNTQSWLSRIAVFVDQPLGDTLRNKLRDKLDFTVPKENVESQKRQVAPGDHKRKLKPETIAAISEQMKDELAFFGYK